MGHCPTRPTVRRANRQTRPTVRRGPPYDDQVRLSVWPTPTSEFADIAAFARHAEQTGWDGFWFADHFMPDAPDNSGPTLECWSVLAAVAALVPRLRLGSLVCGNTYRHPAVLANQAAAVDVISGGRLVLGIGAGWQENEHRAYGIPFYSVGERGKRLAEACAVITSLLHAQRASFDGEYYTLVDAPLSPRPVQQPLPLLVGGGGEQVTMRVAARYADEWNVWGTPERLRHKQEVLDRHCQSIDRDPRTIRRSANALAVAGADVEPLSARTGRPVVGGSDAQIEETLGAYRAAGVDELILADFALNPAVRLDTYDRILAIHRRSR